MKTWYNHLSEFIDILKKNGELLVIDRPVSRFLEISRLTDEQSKSPGGGKALYFSRVEDSAFPVATNLFGSLKRVSLALGVDHPDRLGDRLRRLLEMEPPKGLKQTLSLLPMAFSVTRFFPRRWKSGTPPCQEVVHTGDDVDLTALPVLTCWPKDAGPFITLPLVFTKSPDSGRQNLGMYRLQVFDRQTTGMHWHLHKDGAHFYQEYCRAGKNMPVSVAIGADPATIYAATAPLPRNIDEMILAGFIRNRPVKMARCLTNELMVPAEAEFVLEGYVAPGELRREGPFGDHTGYYSLADDYPVFHVTALTHRRSPVYGATLVGPPPMEDCYLALATERLFLPLLQAAFPEIKDYWLPWEGVFHNLVVVAIHKEYPGQAQKVMSGLWGQGQMSFCKTIVVVDDEVDLKDPPKVLAGILNRLDLTTDLTLTRGVLDVLDHSSPTPVFGSKIGLDLTRRFPGEPERRTRRETPGTIAADDWKILAQIRTRFENVHQARCLKLPAEPGSNHGTGNRVLFLVVEKGEDTGGAYLAQGLLDLADLRRFNIIILYDVGVDLDRNRKLLWKLFNNVDPGRDLHFRDDRLVIDACAKGPRDGHLREWPEELTFD